MVQGKPWTREELIVAMNLYCKLEFGQLHHRNPDIIKLAEAIDRTPNSVSFKLGNFASIDPNLDRKGLSNYSKLDKEIWEEFQDDWENLAFESEKISASFNLVSDNLSEPEKDFLKKIAENPQLKEGLEEPATVKRRINQSFFRKAVLSNYQHSCAITGIKIQETLIASHIVSWADDKENRINPHNGICLNAFHDKLFDRGLMYIGDDYEIVYHKKVKAYTDHPMISKYTGKIRLPQKFLPDPVFLRRHREMALQD